tara:strand:- start:161 stop:403 length:243 start_codon:yes stop_codon:yes gene_type:complete
MVKTYPYTLIGEEIVVVRATNKSLVGIEGKVVDESRYLLQVEQNGEVKKLLKNQVTFKIKRTNRLIEGKLISKRPEERLK